MVSELPLATGDRSRGSKAAGRRPQARGEGGGRRILAAAEELFAERGYPGTSLEAIATAVGIQQPGLLYYFPNKRALYEAVVDDALGALGSLSEAALESDLPAAQRVLASIEAWVDAIAARPTVARLMLHESANPSPASVPAIFGAVGARVERMLVTAFAELGVDAQPDDVFHFISTVTGSTVFYVSAMQQLMAEPAAEHSMQRHKALLLGTVAALIDQIGAEPDRT